MVACMTTYSLLIETDSLQELHDMLGVFLEATRSPRNEDRPIQKENIPLTPRSAIKQDHGESCAYCKGIEDYIRDCLRHEMDFADILFSLKQLKGISMSPAELGRILEEMAE